MSHATCSLCGIKSDFDVHPGTRRCWDVANCDARLERNRADALEAALRQCVEALEYGIAEFEADADAYEEKYDERPRARWVSQGRAALKAAREALK